MEIQTGSIVYSKAGRDKSNILLVLKVEDGYAYVADGIQKKLKHLQKTNQVFEIGDNPANSDIRKILAKCNN